MASAEEEGGRRGKLVDLNSHIKERTQSEPRRNDSGRSGFGGAVPDVGFDCEELGYVKQTVMAQ